MRIVILICAVFVFRVAAEPASVSASARASSVAASAIRDPDVPYSDYLAKIRRGSGANVFGKPTRPPSAADAATPYQGVATLSAGPAWESEVDLNRRFALMRDARHMVSPGRPDFARRATWLYPEDGCYARATVAIAALLKNEPAAPPPAKIFVFGNLGVNSAYARIGRTTWWYHVAPLVRVGERAYVLDPAIDAARPLGVDEWIARQTSRPDSTQVVVCNTSAHLPSDRCDGPDVINEARAVADEIRFMNLEWTRLIELGRDPETELGERPPWR